MIPQLAEELVDAIDGSNLSAAWQIHRITENELFK
jgi:hypothetical protein